MKKNNMQKLVAFQYTSDKYTEREVRGKCPLPWLGNGLGKNTTEEVKVLHMANLIKLKKKSEIFPYPWIGSINSVRKGILLKTMERVNVIPIKILTKFFTDNEKKIEFYMETQKTQTQNIRSNPI